MRRMAQTAEKETDGWACTGRFGRRATRRRLNHSAGQSQSEAVLQIRTAHRAPEWRHPKMEAAAGPAQSAPEWRLYAAISAANLDVEKALKSLSEALDNMKVRSL